VIQLVLTVALLAAVVVVGTRRWQRTRAAGRRPGATIHAPIEVSGFDEIDATVQHRRCVCGGWLALSGETSRAVGARRYRVVRLVCGECGREELVCFDVTAVFQ
jgi:hypothetical protein